MLVGLAGRYQAPLAPWALLEQQQLTHGLNLGWAGCVKLPLQQSHQVIAACLRLHREPAGSLDAKFNHGGTNLAHVYECMLGRYSSQLVYRLWCLGEQTVNRRLRPLTTD